MTVHSWGHAIDIASAQNNINKAVAYATQFARERDAAEAECKRLKGELAKENEKYLTLGHKYNDLVGKYNGLIQQLEKKDEEIDDLKDDVKTGKEIIQDKKTKIDIAKRLMSMMSKHHTRVHLTSKLDQAIVKNENMIKGILDEMKHRSVPGQHGIRAES